jgi:hypothetical protein
MCARRAPHMGTRACAAVWGVPVQQNAPRQEESTPPAVVAERPHINLAVLALSHSMEQEAYPVVPPQQGAVPFVGKLAPLTMPRT